ncbi:MAG: hypothetical protein GVY08_07355 [Bacteroidetes bacterium]|jgi:hypothetical protein|nr:hypothetical protein [Bacteroidota bacterium]
MKYIVYYFDGSPASPGYLVSRDVGDGMEVYEPEIDGATFVAVAQSPVGWISDVCERDGYEIIQVIEEDNYNKVRFYLKKISTASASA